MGKGLFFLSKNKTGGLFVAQLFSNISNLSWQQAVMWLIGGILIYLAIKRDMEPALLLPMGFGAILVNLPLSGVVTSSMVCSSSSSSM